MIVAEKQTNHENQKIALSRKNARYSAQKTKAEISNSFLRRIISLLKKEELI